MHMKEISRKCLIFPGCSPIIKRRERIKKKKKERVKNVKKKDDKHKKKRRKKLEEIATR